MLCFINKSTQQHLFHKTTHHWQFNESAQQKRVTNTINNFQMTQKERMRQKKNYVQKNTYIQTHTLAQQVKMMNLFEAMK